MAFSNNPSPPLTSLFLSFQTNKPAYQVLQLDEMLDIRHSAFIIGPPASGKSAIWKTLQAAKGLQNPANRVKSVVLNPKVVPTAQLYGYINMKDREWKDGLLSSIMRDLGR